MKNKDLKKGLNMLPLTEPFISMGDLRLKDNLHQFSKIFNLLNPHTLDESSTTQDNRPDLTATYRDQT